MKKTLKKRNIKKISAVLLLLICLFSTIKVFGAGNILEISKIRVVEKSETVDVNKIDFEGFTVETDVVFHQLNDFIKYEIVFKNTTNNDYMIDGISNTASNDHVEYTCEGCDKKLTIKAGEEAAILLTATYKNELNLDLNIDDDEGFLNEGQEEKTEMDKRNESNDFKLQITLIDDKGETVNAEVTDNKASTRNVGTNPKTNDNIKTYLILGMASLVGLMVVTKKKGRRTLLLIALIALPIGAKASGSSMSLQFKTKYKFEDKYVEITVAAGDEEFVVIAENGTVLDIPNNPGSKDGYDFEGYYINGEKYTGSQIEFRGDMTVEARYTPRNDTPYTVKHKKQNLNGTSYTLEETERLTGTTDTMVTPSVRNYTGFTSPATISKKIEGDGSTEIIYLYTRNEYQVTFETNGGSSIAAKTVKYGATVGSVSTPTKDYHDFAGWYKDSGLTQAFNINQDEITGPTTLYAKWEETNVLADRIILNAKSNRNGTNYSATPLTMPGHVPSLSGDSDNGESDSFVLNQYSNANYFGSEWVAYSQEDYKRAENAIRRYRKFKNSDSDDDAYPSSTEINDFLIGSCEMMIGKMVAIVEDEYDKPFVYPEYLVTGCSDGYPVVSQKESELAKTTDDNGDSYYFRGTVEDNYVNFSGMCWRIVRIEGDNSVKLILEDKDTTCNSGSYTGNWVIDGGAYGYTATQITNPYGGSDTTEIPRKLGDYENGMKRALEDWLGDSDTGIDQSKLKNDEWCLADKTSIYLSKNATRSQYRINFEIGDELVGYTAPMMMWKDADDEFEFFYKRLWNLSDDYVRAEASLRCSGAGTNYVKATGKVGALSVDEVVFAGGKVWKPNNYYLINDYQKNNKYSNQDIYFLTVSLADYTASGMKPRERSLHVRQNGHISSSDVSTSKKMTYRPVIVLNAGTEITNGNGTRSNPYVVE